MARNSRSLDRSSINSELIEYSRSASDSSLQSRFGRRSTLDSASISSSLKVNLSNDLIEYCGPYGGSDYYGTILGPTADESILVGLQILTNLGITLPSCKEPPPKQKLSESIPESIKIESPIGESEEKLIIDYEKPEEETEPEPESESSKSSVISSNITSEESVMEPSKESTVIIPPSIIEEPEIEEVIVEEVPPEPEVLENEVIIEEELVEEIKSLPEPEVEEIEVVEEIKEEKVVEEIEEEKVIEEEENVEEVEDVEELQKAEVVENVKEVEIVEEVEDVKIVQVVEEVPLMEVVKEIEEPIEKMEPSIEEKEDLLQYVNLEEVTDIINYESSLSVNSPYNDENNLETRGFEADISQDESETSETLRLKKPLKKGLDSRKGHHTSKFANEIIVAAATYAQNDQTPLKSEESRKSINKPSIRFKSCDQLKMSETDTEPEEKKYSKKSSKHSKQEVSSTESKVKDKNSKERRESKDRIESKDSRPSRKENNELKKDSKKDNNGKERKRSNHQELSRSNQKTSGNSTQGKTHKSSNKELNQTKREDKPSRKNTNMEDTIEEVTETEDQSVTTKSSLTPSDSSDVDISEEKPRKKNYSSSGSNLKCCTSSKSKASSTDTYICACHIYADNDNQKGSKSICQCSSCSNKQHLVVPCPFVPNYVKAEASNETSKNVECCQCKKQKKETQDKGTCGEEKLLCDCYTSTSSTGYTSGSDSCSILQRGDGEANPSVRYAITKITQYGQFTTYEVMKSTKKVPKFIPKGVEGVFVLKHKS